MWVGQTYYFTWLDAQFSKLEKKATAGAPPASVWMVHSGGFYAVGKKQSLEVEPEQVRWFRWEALMTRLSGMVLLFLVYYFTGGLIDTDVADISQGCGIAIGLAVLAASWIPFKFAPRRIAGTSQTALPGFGLGRLSPAHRS